MRGRAITIALLSAAPGHSALLTPLAGGPPPLAASPYAPELAADPFGGSAPPGSAIAPAATPSARPAKSHAAVLALAPSPYLLDLLPDPYAAPPALAVAPLRAGLPPRALAPSPYEPQLPSELAPMPY
jgi:hypothetical protein